MHDEVPPNDWKLVNIKTFGLYRVDYDDINFFGIVEQLKANHSVSSLVFFS
jgi:hypothetical protein